MNNAELLVDFILEMQKDISVIKAETIRNTANLELHMRRTDQNEALLEMQEQRIRKLENHDKLMNGLWKGAVALVSLVGTILGIVLTIHQLR